MSEPQTEYETEQGTDAEPDFSHIHAPWHLEPSDGLDDVPEGYLAVINENDGLVGYAWEDDAPIIAAAGTAAQEAREMGYDPQEAVEALPDLLARLVQIRSKLSASSLRREICVDDSMKEKVDEAVDLADDALASAEGSRDE